jgi:hypothetical protein
MVSTPELQRSKKGELRYEDFKEEFERAVERMELPENKKAELMQLPTEAKLKILQQFQSVQKKETEAVTPLPLFHVLIFVVFFFFFCLV